VTDGADTVTTEEASMKSRKTRKVIVDCDNTFGVPGRPIDDGQTLLYLLGREDIEIIGITTTFGNSSIEDVFPATCWLMEQVGRTDIPVLKGAGRHGEGPSEASRFLADAAAAAPGEITLIAIGTLANLKAAADQDPLFFRRLEQIVTMGGYLHQLPYRGWSQVGEVNFSGDGRATWEVLRAECPVVIFNAHICFAVPFGFRELAPIAEHDLRQYFIMKELLLSSSAQLGEAQDYLWDLLPAVYVSYPELFHSSYVTIGSSPEEIEAGYLELSPEGARVCMPDYIIDIDRCYEVLYEAWRKVRMNPDGPWYDETAAYAAVNASAASTAAAAAAKADCGGAR